MVGCGSEFARRSLLCSVPILTATNLELSYGQRVILAGVSLTLEPGEKIGVVGRNGAGKSSMLKIMAGLIPFDSGTVAMTKGARNGYLHQDPQLDPNETLRGAAEAAFAELHRLHRELDKVFDLMGTAEGDALDKLLEKQSKLETQMEAAGGYAIDHKIGEVLHGLGFTDAQFDTPVRGLSGGQRGRLALAQLLLEEPDVLLLDEPTNHLDIDGRLWLENFLKNEYHGAVILISRWNRRSASPSRASASFSATTRPRVVSVASTTRPMPPRAISWPSS